MSNLFKVKKGVKEREQQPEASNNTALRLIETVSAVYAISQMRTVGEVDEVEEGRMNKKWIGKVARFARD